jgi:hypothetical protein
MDLEAMEMALRAGMHRAGAAALSQLLQFPEPAPDQRAVLTTCARTAIEASFPPTRNWT